MMTGSFIGEQSNAPLPLSKNSELKQTKLLKKLGKLLIKNADERVPSSKQELRKEFESGRDYLLQI
jgi:hypothetical protein